MRLFRMPTLHTVSLCKCWMSADFMIAHPKNPSPNANKVNFNVPAKGLLKFSSEFHTSFIRSLVQLVCKRDLLNVAFEQ